jgi:serine/threonine protein kinase
VTDPQPPRTLTSIKQYRLIREIGRGGMGAVYEGVDNRDESRVAIKLLHPWLVTADASYADRFEREAHIAALLRSPYTVRLVDFGVAEGFHYLVMEFVDGVSLADALGSGPLDPVRALRIAIDTARALEEADARGVVHRDIKPANILLTPDGRVKVADFGIARYASGSGVTMAGTFVGTADYAAPEQMMGEADTRADVYALGATLYFMLSGHPPFQASSAAEVLRMQQNSEPPSEPLAHLPASIVNPVRRCLEKDPRDRYQTPTELGSALERALAAYVRGTQSPSRPAAAAPTGESRTVAAAQPATVVPKATAPLPPNLNAQPPARSTSVPAQPRSNTAYRPEPAAAAPATSKRLRNAMVVAGVVVVAAVVAVAVLAFLGGGSPQSQPVAGGASLTPGSAPGAALAATGQAAPTLTPSAPTAVLPTPVLAGFPTLALPSTSPEREIIDTVNRNGPAYAAAINRRDESVLAGVFTGDALAQFTQEVHDERAKPPGSQSALLSIDLVTLQPSANAAAVTTRERWRYQAGNSCNEYAYDESYQLTLLAGVWKVAKNESVLTSSRPCQ